MNCPCDKFIHPPGLKIRAGLTSIPRQIAGFPEFRSAMLAAIGGEVALADWRARGEDDLGIMLLEMWAYVCDVLAFYDEVIAHETYLRTIRRRPSLRKLIELLGYLPCPAVAASVKLALLVEGHKPVTLPTGTAFRSGAFDSEPPQVFETTSSAVVHPLFNSWSLAPIPKPTIGTGGGNTSQLLLEPYSVNLEVNDVILVRVLSPARTRTGKVNSVTTITGQDGNQYTQVTLSSSAAIPRSTPPGQIRLSTPGLTASPWSIARIYPDLYAIDNSSQPGKTALTLDGLYRQIKPGQYVVLQKGQEYRWFTVTKVIEEMMQSTQAGTTAFPRADGGTASVPTPAIKTPATRLVLDVHINNSQRRMSGPLWGNSVVSEIIVHYGFTDAGTVTTERQTEVSPAASLSISQAGSIWYTKPIEQPQGLTSPKQFLLEDAKERGAEVKGSVDFSSASLTLHSSASWSPPLAMPTTVYGNVVSASRGESVVSEVLGSGDASIASQSFKLKKSPLTYLSSPTSDNESGVASTLQVYVNGILWKAISTFFGVGSSEEVYIVRQNDDGESTVIFGDGVRGARLPTGISNVIANYRYGAGAASPPAGSITQLAKPVKGIQSVKGPVAASGGGDAESSKDLRKYAPRSALILGRAVSIADMEAVAASVSGVRAVSAEWRWHSSKQRPVVLVWYIGESSIKSTVSQKLRNLSEPSIPISAEVAEGTSTTLSLDVEIDSRYLEKNVLKAIRKALMDKETGLLSPERIGIGQPVFRSRIFEAVVEVPGAVGVRDIEWNSAPFSAFAKKPEAGKYFDLEKGSLVLNGEDS